MSSSICVAGVSRSGYRNVYLCIFGVGGILESTQLDGLRARAAFPCLLDYIYDIAGVACCMKLGTMS